jgi:pimeloyl-ACP methyl ester carboxylesterase
MWRLERFIGRAREAAGEWLDLDGTHNQVERQTDLDGHPRPVLLLQGFLSTRRTFRVLEARLRRDGYGVFSLNLGGLRRVYNTRGIDDLADFVRAKVDRVYARHPGLGPLTVIGHSKGGLVAAYYVKKLGGWRHARAVVTLGAPFHGTPRAWLAMPMALLAPSIPQLVPGSRFLRRLHDGAWPPEVRLTSIWSKQDAMAPWPSPVLDPHGSTQVRNVEVDCAHLDFLTRKGIYQVIRREVAAGAAPGREPLTVMSGGRIR